MLWYEKLFIYVTYFVYLCYIFVALGVWHHAPEYLSIINYLRQVYVGITLLVVFNPLRSKIKFTEFHRKIIFTSSLFLLTPIVSGLSFFKVYTQKA